MHRFGSLNPDNYGGMPSFLAHIHESRRENSEATVDSLTSFGGRHSSVSRCLGEVGRPIYWTRWGKLQNTSSSRKVCRWLVRMYRKTWRPVYQYRYQKWKFLGGNKSYSPGWVWLHGRNSSSVLSWSLFNQVAQCIPWSSFSATPSFPSPHTFFWCD